MKRFPGAICAALALALAAPLAQAQQAHQGMMPMMQKNMQQMMSMQMTGKPDVDFAMMMREHHKQGIEMAQWELQNGKDQKMRDMAQKIIDAQKKESAELTAFLERSGHSAAMGASGGGQGSAGHGGHSK